MTDDRTTLLVRLRKVTNARSDASGNPVKKLHTAEHGDLLTEPGASVGYAVENFLPRYSAERASGRPVTLTLASNGRVVGIDLPRIGLPEAVPAATRDEVRDEIAGHPIGSGYYANSVSVDEAAEIADALLDRFTITPRADR